jgi:hypothetical protein
MKSTDGLLQSRLMCTDFLIPGRPDDLLAAAACS